MQVKENALEGAGVFSFLFEIQIEMPQLDKLTYFSQFFWLCLLLFTFYILLFNNNNGILGISRILKLRNKLLSHRGARSGARTLRIWKISREKVLAPVSHICTPVYPKYPNGVRPSTIWEKGGKSL